MPSLSLFHAPIEQTLSNKHFRTPTVFGALSGSAENAVAIQMKIVPPITEPRLYG